MTVDIVHKRVRLDRRLNSVISLYKLSNEGVVETDLLNKCILEGLHSLGVLNDEEYNFLKEKLKNDGE